MVKQNTCFFSRGKVRNAMSMYINVHVIERVDSFCYLGVVFKYNNTFQLAIKINVAKSKKAFFKITSEAAGHNLSVVSKLHFIDSLIIPILLYDAKSGYTKILIIWKFFIGISSKTCYRFAREHLTRWCMGNWEEWKSGN